jgi:hypothetical protein
MTVNKFGTGLVVAALAVGLAACGSSSDKTLSKSDLVAKANAICSKATEAGKKIAPPTSLDDPAVVAAYFDKVIPLTKKEVKDLNDLKPASDIKDDYDAYLAALGKAETLVEKVQKKAHAKDPSGKTDLQNARTGIEIQKTARKVGIKDCER